MKQLAQITNPAISTELQDKTGQQFLADFMPAVVNFIFVAGALIFFFMFVIGAIQWIASGGDKAAVESARGRIVSAVIGLVLLFVAFVAIQFIENFFGVNILTIDIGPLTIE